MGWKNRPETLAKSAEKAAETVTRGAIVHLWRQVVRRSPVDTGRFRANWQFNEGSPIGTQLEVNTAPSPPNVVGNPLGKTYYLTNNVPYAGRLDQGSSQQAPMGVTALSILETEAWIAEKLK